MGYLEILGSDKVLRELIITELKEVQKDFGDARRTAIVDDEGEISLEDLIKPEDVVVTVTRGGYLKRTSLDTYRRQSRGGRAASAWPLAVKMWWSTDGGRTRTAIC